MHDFAVLPPQCPVQPDIPAMARCASEAVVATQSMTFGGGRDPVLVDMIARWVIAMPYVLKAHVTEVKDLSVQLQVRAAFRV